jgi:hypothetical protein
VLKNIQGEDEIRIRKNTSRYFSHTMDFLLEEIRPTNVLEKGSHTIHKAMIK